MAGVGHPTPGSSITDEGSASNVIRRRQESDSPICQICDPRAETRNVLEIFDTVALYFGITFSFAHVG